MDNKELQMILTKHKKWAFGNGGKRADLSHATLRNATLRNADLSYANLTKAKDLPT